MKPTFLIITYCVVLSLGVYAGGCLAPLTNHSQVKTIAPASQPVEAGSDAYVVNTAVDESQQATGAGNIVASVDKIAGISVEQVAPYGVIALLMLWLILQSVAQRMTIGTHAAMVKQLVEVIHCTVKLGREALWTPPPAANGEKHPVETNADWEFRQEKTYHE